MKKIIAILLSVYFFSCTNKFEKKNITCVTNNTFQSILKRDYFGRGAFAHVPTLHELDSAEKTLGPIFGYRFIISGDFDGDGKKETLTEHFFSKNLNRETNKFYDSLDYDYLVGFTTYKDPFSFAICNNKKIDTLIISDFGQLLGLTFMKNEGDLNGDGNDEISYVVNWGDWSNCNTCHIVTLKKGKWKEIYSFDTWDSQFPDLPQWSDSYENYFDKTQQENDLKNFPGVIKKMKNGKVRIAFINLGMEDTLFVRLK